jgi:hypothetical protein
MDKGNNKRGLMPSQPAAALSALDFAATAEALRRARTVGEDAARTGDDLATEAAADLVAELSDRLISTPISDPAKIAEKVAAFAWLHNTASGLDNPAQQRWIAENGGDSVKGLLAIYLDLTAGQPRIDRESWSRAVAAYDAAKAKLATVTEAEQDSGEDVSPEWEAANAALYQALDAVLATRAPDASAMGLKARIVVEHHCIEWDGDSATDPAYVSRLLAGEPNERFIAAIYQDGLALSGDTGPLFTAQPAPFDPDAWLAEVEARTGSKLTPTDPFGNAAFLSGDAATANAALKALHPCDNHEVIMSGRMRADREQERERRSTPTPPANLRSIFLNGLLNTFAEGGEREAMRADLASLGLVVE